MNTQEIAERLVALNRVHDYKTAYAELFAPGIVSVEHAWGGTPMEFKGMEGIAEKGKKWEENLVEMHEMKVSEPLVADKSFGVTFFIDATFKDMGRTQTTELALYVVADGKIVREEFFA